MTELGIRRLAWLLWGPGLAAFILVVLVPGRPDRVGHFLAGFGATLAAGWLVALAARGRPAALVGATIACVALGHLVEAHVFPLGGYDVLDVAAQSAGAVHAGLALLAGRAGDPEDDWFDRERLMPSPYGQAIFATAVVALAAGTWSAFR